MIYPLAKIDDATEKAIASVANVANSKDWLAELRLRSETLCHSSDFPDSTVRKCSKIETALSDTPGALLKFYVWLASGCLTTAFIMTQRNAALRRIETSSNEFAKSKWMDSIRSGEAFGTVGFSHLTTSRRHLIQPPLQATRQDSSWVLDGYIPWVTGGMFANWLVIGAVVIDSMVIDSVGIDSTSSASVETKPLELLICVAKETHGIVVEESNELMALNGSSTGQVRLKEVVVDEKNVLHGPIPSVMEASSKSTEVGTSLAGKGGAGGLQTSALALGHAAQSIEYLLAESLVREELRAVAQVLQKQWESAFSDLMAMDQGNRPQDPTSLRKRANDLALHSSQAALVAAKGLGFTRNNPVGRWCQEAMFFLVWSCPQNVTQAHLCSFMA